MVFTGTTLYVSKYTLLKNRIEFLFFISIYFSYDDGIEQIIDYQRIPVENIEKIEIGPEASLFKSTNFDILRIHYRINEESGYSHSFKSSCFRFFNNLVITMKSVVEESGIFNSFKKSFYLILLINHTESLKGIAQTLKYTAMYYNYNIPLEEDKKLSRYFFNITSTKNKFINSI